MPQMGEFRILPFIYLTPRRLGSLWRTDKYMLSYRFMRSFDKQQTLPRQSDGFFISRRRSPMPASNGCRVRPRPLSAADFDGSAARA